MESIGTWVKSKIKLKISIFWSLENLENSTQESTVKNVKDEDIAEKHSLETLKRKDQTCFSDLTEST